MVEPTPVLSSILEIQNLSSGARQALIGLWSFRNKRTGQCNPKMAKLAERLGGVPGRTLRRWVQELRFAGILDAQKHRGSSSYFFHIQDFHSVEIKIETGQNGQSRLAKNGHSGGPYPLYEQSKLNMRVPRIPPKRSLSITHHTPTMDEKVLEAYYQIQRDKAAEG